MMRKNIFISIGWSLFALLAAGSAHAAEIISNGTVALGVKDTGALNVSHTVSGTTVTNVNGPSFEHSGGSFASVGGTGVRGLFGNPTASGAQEGFEATFPGCTCEGWGAAIASLGTTGYDGNGISGLSNISAVFGTDGDGNGIATTTADVGGVLRVVHDFKPSASEFLYQVDVTISNISGNDLGSGATDLRYTRLMDWDTEPTPFSEFVTIAGHPATNLINSSDDGFEQANPLLATSSILGCAPEDTNFTDCGPGDHGARFDFGFDALLGADDPTTPDVDESERSFTIFYGAAPTESEADAARAAVAAEVYSYGQCNPSNPTCSFTDGTPITYIFAFAGVGGTAPDPDPDPDPMGVSEPGTVLLLAIGLLGLGVRARRSQRQA